MPLNDGKMMAYVAELNLRGLVEISEDGVGFGLTEEGKQRAKELLDSIEYPDRLLVILLIKYGVDEMFDRTGDSGYTE